MHDHPNTACSPKKEKKDSAPREKEGSRCECGRTHDTLSCFFRTALWLGHCKSTVTQTQPEDTDLACCRILPFNSITCSQVGPMSLEWPAVPPGGFAVSCSSPSREDPDDAHLENAHFAFPKVRWTRDALHPPEIQQVRRDGNTCPSMCCLEENTQKNKPWTLKGRTPPFKRLTCGSLLGCLKSVRLFLDEN